ncbi:single-stranded-DNA-specific exonuclease RecJ [Candidatus Daviesbacteria bacterium]|nr:single-stranded-DNA-specific exonuclease RecJ [Candidatus Daviesbacteria bacterium]
MITAKIWKVKERSKEDLIEQLLLNRGLNSKKQKDEFFNPKLENFQKDLEIKGIKIAQKRIQKAIYNQELIIVYGDYDVDGIAASAIVYKALTSLGAKILPYIPHREKEGYGLSKLGLEHARDSGATLVITVDNGIVAIKQAEFAKELGLDLIITDHHLPLDEKPQAFAIVHSIKMCGAGVAWCLVKDLIKKDLSDELLQFVVIATIADLMPLVGLGRAFAVEGLKQLNQTKNLGLVALMKESGLEPGEITGYDVGYILAPRLNAIGRLEHAIDALRLLCTNDPIKATKLAKLCSDTNSIRQKITEEAMIDAKALIDSKDKSKIHIVDSEKWVPGIIGLIAGRISEEYYRPAIAISIGEGISKGSARSINGVNIVEIIRTCSDILVDVGGHSGAAGFSIANDKIAEFKLRIRKHLESLEDFSDPILEIDAEVSKKDLTLHYARLIEKFAPFGLGNPRPLLISSAMAVSDLRTVGEGKHLKFKVSPSVIHSGAARNEGSIDCIAFNMGDLKDILIDGILVDLVFYLEVNRFNGTEKIQLKVKDLKLA